jgi:hypothetical protein
VVHPLSAVSEPAGGGYITLTMMALSSIRPWRRPVVIHRQARGE